MSITLTAPTEPVLQLAGPSDKPPRKRPPITGGPCELCGHSLSIHNYEGRCVMGAGTQDRCPCDSTPGSMR